MMRVGLLGVGCIGRVHADGVKAQLVAEAAVASLDEHRPVKVVYSI